MILGLLRLVVGINRETVIVNVTVCDIARRRYTFHKTNTNWFMALRLSVSFSPLARRKDCGESWRWK